MLTTQPTFLLLNFIQTDERREYVYILYKVPVLNNRDVCVYSETMPGTLDNPNQPRTITLMSRSVVHPLCPTVRRELLGHHDCIALVFAGGAPQFPPRDLLTVCRSSRVYVQGSTLATRALPR